MFFNFVFMFLWFYPPSAKTETKDTYKIPCRLYVNRGHFYFGQRGQPYFGFGGQINLGPRGHPRLGFPPYLVTCERTPTCPSDTAREPFLW